MYSMLCLFALAYLVTTVASIRAESRRKYLTILVGAVVMVLNLSATGKRYQCQGSPISELVVFGDSNSDTGNWRTRYNDEGIYQGRYSDGPVWVEELAFQLNLPAPMPSNGRPAGTNFAWGGARTGFGLDLYSDHSTPTMGAQVAEYLGSQRPSPSALFVMQGGANDFDLGGTDPALPAANLLDHISTLAGAGGSQFLVANMFPMGDQPGNRGSGREAILNQLSREFNRVLSDRLPQLATELNVSIYTVDLYGLVEQAIADPRSLGLNGVASLWADNYHFSTRVHREIGRVSAQSIGQLDVPMRVILQAQELSSRDFYDQDLRHAILRSSKLNSANFAQADLSDASLRQTILDAANFTAAVVSGADFGESNLTKEQLYVTASFLQSSLRGIGLQGLNLEHWNLSRQDLTQSDLSASKMRQAELSEAILTGSDLSHADLTGANLSGAIVDGVRFTATIGLSREQVYGTASYQNKDLQGIGLGANNLSGWSFRGQDLSNASFHNATLINADFADASLRNTFFSSADLRGTNLAGADISGAFFGSARNLRFDQLAATASYKQRNLRGVSLRGASLSGANLAEQDLSMADLSQADLRSANLASSSFQDGFLLSANLSDAQLVNSNLSGADLSSARLTGAELTGAAVRGTKFAGSRSLSKEQLYSTASYREKNIEGIGLSRMNLSDWDFSGQYLANADLYFANLSGAILKSADLRGANLVANDAVSTNMIFPDGHIVRLIPDDQELFVIRDYDGGHNLRNEPNWQRPREPIPIRVTDEIFLANSVTLQLRLESDHWDSLIFFEPGIPVQLGGTLELTFTDDVDVATQIGRTLRIFDWTGVNPTGQFHVASPYAWDLTGLYTTGEVTLTAVPEPSTSIVALALLLPFVGHCRRRLQNRQ